MSVDAVTDKIIGAAIGVHRELGPGLLESTYEACMVYELTQRGLYTERQKVLPVRYKGVSIDLLVEHEVIVELKAVAAIERVHVAQLLSYLKLSHARVGLLINFHVKQLTAGLRRFVNEYPG